MNQVTTGDAKRFAKNNRSKLGASTNYPASLSSKHQRSRTTQNQQMQSATFVEEV